MTLQMTNAEWTAPDGTRFNDFPEGWREVTEEQFVKSMPGQPYEVACEYRQMLNRDDRTKPMVEARLFWRADDTGYAFGTDYWQGKVHFYLFGCDHKDEPYGPKYQYRCLHTVKCRKCGRVATYDSSD